VRGRDVILRGILDFLQLDDNQARDVRPVVLWGLPGVGKTTVVNALAHSANIEKSFPDGIVWVTLGPRPQMRTVLNALGSTFGLDLLSERDDSGCVERLRLWLHRRRAFVIVDDVWEPHHGASFLLTGPLGRTVFTTRESLVAFPLATPNRSIRVHELQPPDALDMLHELAPSAVTRDRGLAKELCRKLDHLPLAIKLAGGVLAQEGDVPGRIDALLVELTTRRQSRLDLTGFETRPGLDPDSPASMKAILGLSVDRLDGMDRERFALLSTFGCEPLFWIIPHAAAVWDCDLQEAEATTSRLIQRGLVERRGDEYWMHALLADYAEELRLAKGL
jgi:hypothetical protein